jgi:hypothetical protein
VIGDVANQVREAFLDEGVDIEVLQQLKKVGPFLLVEFDSIKHSSHGKQKFKQAALWISKEPAVSRFLHLH